MDSQTILLATAGAFLLAGFVKGVIGFGLPVVAVGMLGLLMTPAQAAAILVLPSLVTNVWQAAVGGDFVGLVRRLWPLLVGICVGTFIGALLVPQGGGAQAIVWLGMVLTIYAGLGLINVHFVAHREAEPWLGLAMGAATGVVTIATGVFTLPGVPYVHALGLDRDRLVQALGLSFTVSAVTMGIALAHAGEMHSGLALPSVLALAMALAGMWLGQIVRRLVRERTFRLCFFLGLLALGLHLALRGLL